MKSIKLSCGGSIRQKDNGKWEGRICIKGKNFSVTESSKTACEREIKKIVRLNEGGLINKKSKTFLEWANIFLEEYKFSVEPTTYDHKKYYINHEIAKASFANKDIGQITFSEIQSYINSLADGTNFYQRKYPYDTIRHIRSNIRQTFTYVVNLGIVKSNPVAQIKLPKKDMCSPSREVFAYSPDEIKRLREVCLRPNKRGGYKRKAGLTILLLLYTGMRKGEALALTWDDIRDGLICINKSMQEKSQHRIAPTKTKSSVRSIPINKDVEFILNELKRVNPPSNIVCCNKYGNYMEFSSLKVAFDEICKLANVRKGRIHLLRHTFGSELIRQGVALVDVSKLMGHSNTVITYKRYIHINNDHLSNVMNKVTFEYS